MTNDDLTFYCEKLSCSMTEAACIEAQQIAYQTRHKAKNEKPSIAFSVAYDRALSCLCCVQGAELRESLKASLKNKPKRKAKPRLIVTTKPKSKPKPKPAPKTPVRVPVPLAERPLCVECGRWVVYSKGLCRACYNRRRRESKNANSEI